MNVDVIDSTFDLPAASAPASAAPAAPAAPAAVTLALSMIVVSSIAYELFAVFSSSLSAPARMSAGDLGLAPDDGEIEISSSIWNSPPRSASAERIGSGTCVSLAKATGDVVARGAGAPPSANIGLLGSSCRPSATALCQTSPWPLVTAYSSDATVSNADGLLCCAWISSSLK